LNLTCGGISKASAGAKAVTEAKVKVDAENKHAADAKANAEKAATEKAAAEKAAADAKVVILAKTSRHLKNQLFNFNARIDDLIDSSSICNNRGRLVSNP
jgi:membrane protein involved in colicin uptake